LQQKTARRRLPAAPGKSNPKESCPLPISEQPKP
jgi:hypothetical protein